MLRVDPERRLIHHPEGQGLGAAEWRDFFDYVTVLDWPGDACSIYGRVRATLEEKGASIGAMDLLIASHALWLDAIIVTDNIREFQRVPDLKIENWKK